MSTEPVVTINVDPAVMDGFRRSVSQARTRLELDAAQARLGFQDRARDTLESYLTEVEREPNLEETLLDDDGERSAMFPERRVRAGPAGTESGVPAEANADEGQSNRAHSAEISPVEASAFPPFAFPAKLLSAGRVVADAVRRLPVAVPRAPARPMAAIALVLVAAGVLYSVRSGIVHGLQGASKFSPWELIKAAHSPSRTSHLRVVQPPGLNSSPSIGNSGNERGSDTAHSNADWREKVAEQLRARASGSAPTMDGKPAGPLAAIPKRDNAARGSAEPLLQRGEQLVEKGDVAGAVVLFTDALRLAPSLERAYLRRGEALARQGGYDAAIADFGEAIRLDPHDAFAYRARAQAFAYRNDNDRAIADLTSAIQFGETGPTRLSQLDRFLALRNRAALYDVKEQFVREVSDLTAMIDAYGKTPELAEALSKSWGSAGTKTFLASIYAMRAKAYTRLTLHDKALADFSIAIEIDSGHAAAAYSSRAEIEEKLGQRAQALDDLRSAMKLDPNLKGVKESLARIGGDSGKH